MLERCGSTCSNRRSVLIDRVPSHSDIIGRSGPRQIDLARRDNRRAQAGWWAGFFRVRRYTSAGKRDIIEESILLKALYFEAADVDRRAVGAKHQGFANGVDGCLRWAEVERDGVVNVLAIAC